MAVKELIFAESKGFNLECLKKKSLAFCEGFFQIIMFF